jgi:hypothetical protein
MGYCFGTNTVGWYALFTCWLDFIEDNKLREGDIYVFEPSKSNGRVKLIFHPLEINIKKTPYQICLACFSTNTGLIVCVKQTD